MLLVEAGSKSSEWESERGGKRTALRSVRTFLAWFTMKSRAFKSFSVCLFVFPEPFLSLRNATNSSSSQLEVETGNYSDSFCPHVATIRLRSSVVTVKFIGNTTIDSCVPADFLSAGYEKLNLSPFIPPVLHFS